MKKGEIGKIVGNKKSIKKTENNKIIIGIDPGLKNLGIGILEINPNNKYKIERNKKKDIISNSLMPLIEDYTHFLLEIKTKRKIEEKLSYIFEMMNQIIEEYSPDQIIVEDSFVGFNKNSSIKIALARGSILSAIGKNKKECMIIPPALIKMTLTQKGNAQKEEINKFFEMNLKNWESQEKFDSSDALAAAFCGVENLIKDY